MVPYRGSRRSARACWLYARRLRFERCRQGFREFRPTKLIVGFDQSYPPYGFVGNDGNYTGFDLDLATEVANRNGWDIQLEAIDWDAKDTLLNSGAINCIWNGFTMEGREDDYTFTDPYMLNAQVVVVKSSSGIKSLDDLAGKKRHHSDRFRRPGSARGR